MTIEPVVLLNDRPVKPEVLRPRVIDHLHAGHPCLSTMCQWLASTMYWPDYMADLTKSKLSCLTCRTIAPSNSAMPPHAPSALTYPFQSIVCDFFSMAGKTFAVVADRYSNWLSIIQLPKDNSQELIATMKLYLTTFGICETLSSDGASIFTSQMFRNSCSRWGIQQRISFAYPAHSNKHTDAEVAVKSAKRFSLSPGGSLDTDAIGHALLAHRTLTNFQASALHRLYFATGSETSTTTPLANTSPGLSGDWLPRTER